MNIGYASLTYGVGNLKYKSIKRIHITETKLREIIIHNLDVLDKTIDYNISNDIHLFRISSDIIPFGSSPLNQIKWWEEFSLLLKNIGKKANENKIRLSMHPGQYTLINSPNEAVVARSILELEYHALFLHSLGLDNTSKIVIHIGGMYNDKEQAINTFFKNYHQLTDHVKKRLVIENDDRLYNIMDCLMISKHLSIPVVFDNLHHLLNHDDVDLDDNSLIKMAGETWKEFDGKQKIHYSDKDELKKNGAHAKTIDLEKFLNYTKFLDVDVMLEVKDKNLSAIKCLNGYRKNIKYLEIEWSKYKYKILANNPQIYNKIRTLLKDKNNYPVILFYGLINEGLKATPSNKTEVNAMQHIIGYFKKIVDYKTITKWHKYLNDNKFSLVKNDVLKAVVKYDIKYLFDSYYFYI